MNELARYQQFYNFLCFGTKCPKKELLCLFFPQIATQAYPAHQKIDIKWLYFRQPIQEAVEARRTTAEVKKRPQSKKGTDSTTLIY